MKDTNFNITTWKEGNLYVSQSLKPDVSSFGKTQKEALENLQEALEFYHSDTD